MTADEDAETAARIRRLVAETRLGSWDDIEHRLRPRLVPTARAGPLSRPVEAVDGGPAPVRLDLGIDLADGIARIDDELVGAWGRDPAALWRRARSNLAATTPPRGLTVPLDPVEPIESLEAVARVFIGGAWTSGWLLLPHRLLRHPTIVAPPDRERRYEPPVALAPDPGLLVIADRALSHPARTLAERLARARSPAGAAPLASCPLRLPGAEPFPAPGILE